VCFASVFSCVFYRKFYIIKVNNSVEPPTQDHFPVPTNNRDSTKERKDRRQPWEGNSALCAKQALPRCVRSAGWAQSSVFSWTGTVSELSTSVSTAKRGKIFYSKDIF